MHTQQVQTSRSRRPSHRSAAARQTRKIGARWRAAAVAMSLGCTVASLTACGGGGGGSSATPVQVAPVPASAPATQTPVSIYMEGDSTMFGAGTLQDGSIPNPNAPQEVQIDLGSSVSVVNEGHSGQTLVAMLNGWGTYTQTYASHLASIPAQVVDENFAINDAAEYAPFIFQQALVDFVNITRAAGKIPVLEEPNPICGPYSDQLAALVGIIDSVGIEMNVPVIKQYAAILAIPNWQSDMQECVHPVTLYKMKGDAEAAVLGPIANQLLQPKQ
jgi:acyl-CoA thioesterase-1